MKLLIKKIQFSLIWFALSMRNTSSMRNRFLLAGISLLIATACSSADSQKHFSAQRKQSKTLVINKNKLSLDSVSAKKSNIGENIVESEVDVSVDSTFEIPHATCYAPVDNITNE